MIYKVTANSKYKFELEQTRQGFIINAQEISIDLHPVNKNTFHILHNRKSYLAELVELHRDKKSCIIKVNGSIYSLNIKDQYDELLHQLGLDSFNVSKITDIKAPMPGLVLSIQVKEGDQVSKGDNLLILEAMKMENIIKSPADAVVKSVKVLPGDKVEKNQALILFL